MYYRRYVRTLTEAEAAELQRMTQQEVGRVAERARMILLSARRYTVQDVMAVFECTDDTVYKWLDRFEADSPEGLHDDEGVRLEPGRSGGPHLGLPQRVGMQRRTCVLGDAGRRRAEAG